MSDDRAILRLSPSKVVNRRPNRILALSGLLAMAFVAVRATVVCAAVLGQVSHTGTLGHDSLLWYMQYHLEGEQEAFPLANDVSPSRRFVAPIAMLPSHDGIEQFGETSLAEVLVGDQEAGPAIESTGVTLSEWEKIRIAASGSPSIHTLSSGGPSATTILVGLVAAIVVCGAIVWTKEVGRVPL